MVIEETVELRLKKTLFVVEASSYEMRSLWSNHSIHSQYTRFEPRNWEQVNPGWTIPVGAIDKRPVCISTMWAKIDSQLIMFWEPSSEIVDHKMIQEWLDKNFTGMWDNGTRRARANAMNFHHCLTAIDQANGVN